MEHFIRGAEFEDTDQAIAEMNEETLDELMDLIDANNDNTIDQKEMVKFLTAMFQRVLRMKKQIVVQKKKADKKAEIPVSFMNAIRNVKKSDLVEGTKMNKRVE